MDRLRFPRWVQRCWSISETRLRGQGPLPLPLRQRIQIVVLAHEAGLLSWPMTLQKLFRLTFSDERFRNRGESPLDALDERLKDGLVSWDCQEDLDVVEPPLQAKFTALFREYLSSAKDVAAVLPGKFKRK